MKMRLGRVRLSLLFWVEVGIGGGSEICGEEVLVGGRGEGVKEGKGRNRRAGEEGGWEKFNSNVVSCFTFLIPLIIPFF